MKAGNATNQRLRDLLRGWLEQLAADAARQHGPESAQFAAITYMQANLDDAALSNLRLAD